jgi:glycine/D-amino acid oxidase-like deaminating enzyme
MRTDDLFGGLWIPADGSGSPTDLTMSLLAGAKMRGGQLHENVRVESFNSSIIESGRKRITGVTTVNGDIINADIVVLCGGQWSR